MIKLTPITKDQYNAIVLEERLQELLGALPAPTKGSRGADGPKGEQGTPGVTTTVTREVLANKEALLEKEEFEEFKAMMLKMENDLRQSLAQTHNYFPGGAGGIAEIANVVEVSVDTTITTAQLPKNQINIILVLTAGITVTLPEPDVTRIVWVQQGYTTDGEFTICRA